MTRLNCPACNHSFGVPAPVLEQIQADARAAAAGELERTQRELAAAREELAALAGGSGSSGDGGQGGPSPGAPGDGE